MVIVREVFEEIRGVKICENMWNSIYLKIFTFIMSFNIIFLYMTYFNYNTMYFSEKIKIFSKYVAKDKIEITVENEEGLEKNLPFVPFEFFKRNSQYLTQKIKDGCAVFPDLLGDLQFENTYWQILKIQRWNFLLYGAYYDNRKIHKVPAIKLLAMIEEKDVNVLPNTSCQIWFDNKTEALIVPATQHEMIWQWEKYDGVIYPYIFSCELPKEFSAYGIPKAVSVVEHQCDLATNSLTVHFNPLKKNEQKEDFAVCVKGLDFPYVDHSLHLMEWLEIVRILGAKKVSIYNYKSHENIEKILKYYKSTGFLEVTPFTLSSGQPNLGGYAHLAMKHRLIIQMMNELIVYNDCYMKQMYKYENIVLIDIDEIIMPQNNLTYWSDLMKYAMETRDPDCKDYVSICFRNAYFPVNEEIAISNQVPEYLYMLQHNIRLNETLDVGIATKCIHNSEKIIAIHNHMPVHFQDSCYPRTLDPSIGIMNHYRIPDNGQTVNDSKQIDLTLWRFKDKIIERTEKVFKKLYLYETT